MVAGNSSPQHAFEKYFVGLEAPSDAARLVIAVPERLPPLLRWDTAWGVPKEAPGEESFVLPRLPQGAWQEQVLCRPTPQLDIFIGNTVLHRLRTEEGPVQAALGALFLRKIARQPHATVRLVEDDSRAMGSNGFCGLMEGDLDTGEFGDGVWLGDPNHKFMYHKSRGLAIFYAGVAKGLKALSASATSESLLQAAQAMPKPSWTAQLRSF